MIEITKHKISLQTNHWLVELYESGMRGFCFATCIENDYAYIHICIYRRNLQIQWWKETFDE